MLNKVIPAAFFLVLFAALAFGAPADASTVSPAIELRQYATMLIVGVVCVLGGVWLFFKTAH